MSAFDIAGAILWSVLAACFWVKFADELKTYGLWLAAGKVRASVFTGLAAFCISRLCGAHL